MQICIGISYPSIRKNETKLPYIFQDSLLTFFDGQDSKYATVTSNGKSYRCMYNKEVVHSYH